MLVSSLARAFARSSRGAIRTIPRAFSGIPIPEGSFKNTDDGPDRISLEPRTTLKGRKRFYKRTGYRESPERPGFFEVTLDGRAVKSGGRETLRVPSIDMAMMIAAEWGAQGKVLEPAAMPTMSMAATAQLMGDKRQSVIDNLLKFVETDTVCVRSAPGEDKKLIANEKKHWDPIVAWFREQYGEFHTANGFIMPDQPEETAENVRKELNRMDDWRLTAVQALTQSAKSIAIPLKLFHGKISTEEAFTAARVEEQHQISNCGFVYDGHDVDINFLRLRFFTAACFLHSLGMAGFHPVMEETPNAGSKDSNEHDDIFL
eukprot:INCI10404.3.p1 GENE.INCI10404.3~~INCI10404.3.p1  ORF type:complete len:317 (+),score=58.72 INCI10404.3:88-1038(+)